MCVVESTVFNVIGFDSEYIERANEDFLRLG